MTKAMLSPTAFSVRATLTRLLRTARIVSQTIMTRDINDPSNFCEFDSEVDKTEDNEIQQMIEAGSEPCPRRRERSDDVDVDVRKR